MTNTPLIIDAEDVVGDYLRTHPDVLEITDDVVGQPLGDSQDPWVVVTQLDVVDRGHYLEHLMEYMIQFECFAGARSTKAHSAQAEVNLLGRTVRAALKDMEGQNLDGCTVHRVAFLDDQRFPDTTFEPARQRRILTADITLHR